MKKSKMTSLLGIKLIRKQGITHPFGDHRSVKQAFPAGINSKLSDPFLMCDYFDMQESTGPASDPDEFPVGWHPHRGFDIASYLKSGLGRHGDSLGNRETFETPGMQWMSTGSGVEHAEGGASEKGDLVQGFQIWINVPGERKMDDPRYGTVPTEDLPLVKLNDKVSARVLAGNTLGVVGPFETVQPVEMADFELEPDATIEVDVGKGLNTVMLYVYEGALEDLNDKGGVQAGNVVLMDADSDEKRGLRMKTSSSSKAGVMLFAGKKLDEPIAWHGPIVMNTQKQIDDTIHELRSGQFPPSRVPWDYKKLSAFPHSKESEL
jgi:redox-sensitive bicupin YhaK (pirin superfamily)